MSSLGGAKIMATMARSTETERGKIWHKYHAEANILSGHLKQPVNQEIFRQAPVELNDLRGGHFYQRADNYSLEGLISFKTGYTRVSGNRSLKNHGWVTLATSVLEGLNVLDVVTCDRVVAQVSTEHPLQQGHTPHVTFLGTHFENLRVGGYKVAVELDLGICGEKPAGDKLYTADPGFLDRVEQQSGGIARSHGLPSAVQTAYDAELALINRLKERGAGKQANGSGEGSSHPKVVCSLVSKIGPIPIPGVKSFGNVLEIPGFGVVSLGELTVGEKVYRDDEPSNYFEVSMFNLQMGCIGDGSAKAATAATNGHSHP
jgi:hypothetical protein